MDCILKDSSNVFTILIVQFDSRYEAHYATPLGRKKGSKLSEAEEENMNKKRSNKTAAKYKERQKLAPVSYLNILFNIA